MRKMIFGKKDQKQTPPADHKEQEGKPKSALREWIDSALVALVIALFIRTFFFQPFKIPTGSMIPTLEIGDHLFVNKLHYGASVPFTGRLPFTGKKSPIPHRRLFGFTTPQRGDVIVFKAPLDTKKDFIKRLIALGGETVEIRNGDIYINGKLIEDPEIKNTYYYNKKEAPYARPGTVVKVPENYYFVLGDNSASSYDSRYWGFVPEEDVIGKAEVIYWPLKRIRFIK